VIRYVNQNEDTREIYKNKTRKMIRSDLFRRSIYEKNPVQGQKIRTWNITDTSLSLYLEYKYLKIPRMQSSEWDDVLTKDTRFLGEMVFSFQLQFFLDRNRMYLERLDLLNKNKYNVSFIILAIWIGLCSVLGLSTYIKIRWIFDCYFVVYKCLSFVRVETMKKVLFRLANIIDFLSRRDGPNLTDESTKYKELASAMFFKTGNKHQEKLRRIDFNKHFARERKISFFTFSLLFVYILIGGIGIRILNNHLDSFSIKQVDECSEVGVQLLLMPLMSAAAKESVTNPLFFDQVIKYTVSEVYDNYLTYISILHTRASTFEKFIDNDRCKDVSEIFVGKPCNKIVFQSLSHGIRGLLEHIMHLFQGLRHDKGLSRTITIIDQFEVDRALNMILIDIDKVYSFCSSETELRLNSIFYTSCLLLIAHILISALGYCLIVRTSTSQLDRIYRRHSLIYNYFIPTETIMRDNNIKTQLKFAGIININ